MYPGAFCIDHLAKRTIRSRYAQTPVAEHSEGPMDTVPSIFCDVSTLKILLPADYEWAAKIQSCYKC